MGRRKIEIQPITHERNRSVTFLKRKNGLFKKAYELGVLCSVDIAVIIFENRPGHGLKCYEYTSAKDVRDVVARHVRYDGEKDTKTPRDFNGPHAKESEDEGAVPSDEEEKHGEDNEEEEEKPARKRARMPSGIPPSHRRKHRSRSRSRSPPRPSSSSHHPAASPPYHRQSFYPPSYPHPHDTLFPPPPMPTYRTRLPPPPLSSASHYTDGRAAPDIFGFLGERPFEWPHPPPSAFDRQDGDWLDFIGGAAAGRGGVGGRSWDRE